MSHKKSLDEGGAKQKNAEGKSVEGNQALQKETRQAAKNQSSVDPQDYPDRGATPV